MKTRSVELLVGLFLLMGIVALVVLAVQVSGLRGVVKPHGYTLYANFSNVGDLKARAPVSVAGVQVGQITKVTLDITTYSAIVTMYIYDINKKFPSDTSASILTEGLLGSNYISLTPGVNDDQLLKNQDTINITHSALILENLVGQLLFRLKKDK